jgi:hypothetical protein
MSALISKKRLNVHNSAAAFSKIGNGGEGHVSSSYIALGEKTAAQCMAKSAM